MLGKTTNARFAHQPNPEREKRLLGFAGGAASTGSTNPDEERESGQEPGGLTAAQPAWMEDIGETQKGTLGKVRMNLLLERSEELLTILTEQEPTLEPQIRRVGEAQIPALSGTWRDPESWEGEDRQKILSSLLEEPENALGIARAVDRRIKAFERLNDRAEALRKYVLGEKPYIPPDNPERPRLNLDKDLRAILETPFASPVSKEQLAAILSRPDARMTIETRRAIEKMLGVTDPTRIPPDKQRTLDVVIDYAKTEWALQSYGRRGDREEESREQYLESLRSTRELLLEQLHEQIVARALRLNDEEKERRGAFEREIGIEEKRSDESAGDLDRTCLVRFGCTVTAVREEFDQRHQLCEDIAHCPLGIRPEGAFDAADAHLKALEKLEREGREHFDVRRQEEFAPEQKQKRLAFERWAHHAGLRLREVVSMENEWQGTGLERVLEGFIGASPWSKVQEWHDLLDPYAEAGEEGPEALARLRTQPGSLTESDFSEEERRMMDLTLTCIAQKDVETLMAVAEERAQAKEDTDEALPDDDAILAHIAETRERISTVLSNLARKLEHPVCKKLGMSDAIEKKRSRAEGNLVRLLVKLERAMEQDPPMNTDDLQKLRRQAFLAFRAADRDVAQAELTTELLKGLQEDKVIAVDPLDPRLGEANGRFRFEDGRIYIRNDLSEEARAAAIEHEQGHGIVHIVTRRTRLLPFQLTEAYERMRLQRLSIGSVEDALKKLEQSYGIARQRETLRAYAERERKLSGRLAELCVEGIMRRLCFDELMNRYALWEKNKSQEPADDESQRLEHELFETMKTLERGDERPLSASALASLEKMNGAAPLKKLQGVDYGERLKATLDQPHDDGDDATPGAEGADAAAGPKEANIKQALVDIQRNIGSMEQFLTAYPQLPQDKKVQLRSLLDGIRSEKNELNEKFRRGEESDDLRGKIEALLKRSEKIKEVIDEFDTRQLDTSGTPKTYPPAFIDRFAWLSINDIIKFGKDTFEDFKDVYKRTHDREIREAGNKFTNIMSKLEIKGAPLHFFGMNKYLVQAKQYHVRRYAGEEHEAIEKWKKSMETEDSHDIMHQLATSDNKDQIRGCMALLADRGELDWNDHGIWAVLSKLSGYQMPVQACDRNDVLRDTWLRKLITEIWKDKELYYELRSTNDSKTESHKKNFEATVDQLSNIGGGMGNELERQLGLFKEWKEDAEVRHIHRPFPVEVKPHLYEEIIDYAITNGKMTMEGKFYYLVQGVACGLLSIDRLRWLAGKKLNLFPFIDYFYQKNNSLPFIQELARRLQEPDERKKYKPGIRTTLWLHYEVAREEKAQERLSKALSGARAENIDHEDIPFFLTNVGWNHVNNMTGAISGTRMKVSPEGAKNAYVGYCSKFKIFGALVAAEQQGIARVSQHDMDMLAQTMAGYIQLDNVTTRNACDNHDSTARPMLTAEDFESRPVSSAGPNGMAYRTGMNGLVAEVMQRLSPLIEPNINRAEAGNYTLKDYAPGDAHTFQRNDTAKSKDLYGRLRFFHDAFFKAVRTTEGQRIFKEVIRSHADRLPNEGGSEDLDIGKAVEILRTEGMAGAGAQAAAEHGGGAAPQAAAAHPAHH